jgi:hypothetical protein
MANDKDFKVKNGIQPTVYHEAVGTVNVSGSTATLDLSTGSVFDYTPTSDVQVTLTNPAASGTSSGATLLLKSEDAAGVSSTFSTTLYEGTATSESHRIQNGIDLAGDGGLVWIKKRDSNLANTNHYLSDTERGNFHLASNSTNTQGAGDIASYNSDGWTFNASTGLGTDYNGSSYVSWTFKKQTKFFDIVTYTGNGTNQSISHNLGTAVGSIFVKCTTETHDWAIYHRSFGGGYYFRTAPYGTDPAGANAQYWNNTDATSTEFTVGPNSATNQSGQTYVAYLFAHDTDASSIIKCGSYTGNSTVGHVINLGFEAQWVLVKNTSGTESWIIYDVIRGMPASGNGARIRANDSGPEESQPRIGANSQGFQLNSGDGECNISNNNYIYIAIRSPSIPTITYDSALQWSGGTAPTSPANGETDVYTFNTTDGGTTYQAVQAIDGAK